MLNLNSIDLLIANKTKVESDRLGSLKYLMRNMSRSFLGGAAVCTHVLYTDCHCTVQSVQYISITTKRPFHELEFLVGGWWVCKPILVIGFARARPQANK